MQQDDDNPKNELHKLLKEYEANRGMAGMVCGRPIELMPVQEQDRLFNGFCTKENLQILATSREKFLVARNLDLDESEKRKVETAIQTLAELVEAFNSYMDSNIDKETLREKVRATLEIPIPDTEEDRVSSLSTLIEMLLFLSTQTLYGKDSWDQMIDCVQLHDALNRTIQLCEALQKGDGSSLEKHGQSIDETLQFCRKHIEAMEMFFRGELPSDHLQPQFGELFTDLGRVWGETLQAETGNA